MRNEFSSQETEIAFIYLTQWAELPAQWAEMSIDNLTMLLETQMSDPVFYTMPASWYREMLQIALVRVEYDELAVAIRRHLRQR